MGKRYIIEITTAKAKILWMNGGYGYSEEEVFEVVNRIKADKRVTSYRVIEKR